LPRLRKRRAADNAEQVSSQQPAKKSKIGLLGIAITALVGFFFGIASTQVTDFIKRADDCYDALSQYGLAIASSSFKTFNTTHDPHASSDQVDEAIAQWDTVIQSPTFKVQNKCRELNKNDFSQWKISATKFAKCYMDSACPLDKSYTYQDSVVSLTSKLLDEAEGISKWGLVRRAKYEVTHLY
jgi:hypothetical protein